MEKNDQYIDPDWNKRFGLENVSLDPFPQGGNKVGELIMWGNKQPLPPSGAKSQVEAFMNTQIAKRMEAKQALLQRSLPVDDHE